MKTKTAIYLIFFNACLAEIYAGTTAGKLPSPPLHMAHSIIISDETAEKIGEKIWKNECGGTVKGLTTWNSGENFASLGIGHFIWYPAGRKERFKETFPSLLKFLKEQGAPPPSWLALTSECPWSSELEFKNELNSEKMNQLRGYLYDTRNLQAKYIAGQLENILPLLLSGCNEKDKKNITHIFYRLASSEKGLYALIDYLNFKGAGASPVETYKGEGWGLLQVLKLIPPDAKYPLQEFVKAGKIILANRVQNSPQERNEEKWLKGWFNRLDTYEPISD